MFDMHIDEHMLRQAVQNNGMWVQKGGTRAYTA